MRLACRETLQQAVNMAAARTVSELLWSIFCPFELLGWPAQVKSPIPPSSSNGPEARKRTLRFVFATGAVRCNSRFIVLDLLSVEMVFAVLGIPESMRLHSLN